MPSFSRTLGLALILGTSAWATPVRIRQTEGNLPSCQDISNPNAVLQSVRSGDANVVVPQGLDRDTFINFLESCCQNNSASANGTTSSTATRVSASGDVNASAGASGTVSPGPSSTTTANIDGPDYDLRLFDDAAASASAAAVAAASASSSVGPAIAGSTPETTVNTGFNGAPGVANTQGAGGQVGSPSVGGSPVNGPSVSGSAPEGTGITTDATTAGSPGANDIAPSVNGPSVSGSSDRVANIDVGIADGSPEANAAAPSVEPPSASASAPSAPVSPSASGIPITPSVAVPSPSAATGGNTRLFGGLRTAIDDLENSEDNNFGLRVGVDGNTSQTGTVDAAVSGVPSVNDPVSSVVTSMTSVLAPVASSIESPISSAVSLAADCARCAAVGLMGLA